MKALRNLALASLALAPLSIYAQAPNQTQLQTVLSQMDAASAKFKGATADLHWEYYDRVIRAVSTDQRGSIYFERNGSSIQMGASVLEVGAKSKPKLVEYKDGVLKVYDPGSNKIDRMKAGANQSQYEGFLTLGFGGSGRDLQRVWEITDQGPDTVDGTRTEKLDLIAKDPAVQKTFSHVTLWVDPARGVSLKQVFYTPQKDYRTATYSNIKLTGSINKGPFKLPNVPVADH